MSTMAQNVVDFWFDESNVVCWFDASPSFDARIRERFGDTATAAAQGALDDWVATPTGWLALLLLLDQFPRNLHRDDGAAWAQDVKAQRVVLSGLARGDDRKLPPLQRVFAYLVLEHAEDATLQRRSVSLFEALCADAPPAQRERYEGFLDYARRHAEVIARFGRFPHRNAALGRTNTLEESHYLAQPGAGF
jgi:uncharacterized protein (DUF924 family)